MRVVQRFQAAAFAVNVGAGEGQSYAIAGKSADVGSGNRNGGSGIPGFVSAAAGDNRETTLPCQEGDVAIAGDRATYGKPFANVDRLAPGDKIILTTPVGSCIYEVSQDPFVVLPTDWQVVADTPGRFELTLTACHPKGSASHRIVIKALMVSSSTSV